MKDLFVLGRNDAEMVVIAQLLAGAGQKFVRPRDWGEQATISSSFFPLVDT
jgi:hypothetical protein